MIYLKTFTGDDYQNCIDKINDEIPDSSKIINVVPDGSRMFQGYDEYDRWTEYYMKVIYRD